MLKVKPSKQVLVSLIAVAVLLFIVCGFTYHNRASRLSALQTQVEEKRIKLAESEKIADRLYAVERDLQVAHDQLSALEQGVTTRAYVPTLLRQVEDLGKKVHLNVVGVRPKVPAKAPQTARNPEAEAVDEDGGNKKAKDKEEEKKKPEPYDRLEVGLEMSGKYWDVVKFLEEVTCFPKIIAVNDVQINPVGQHAELSSPELSVKLNTTAFILKEPVARTSDGSENRADAEGRRS